ncbi:MAG: efflux RND transporter permease subunit [Betaproteobacteria bacterium]|nr:efflux RND transporter permease subunit [Betaproteobacteria bacterium]
MRFYERLIHNHPFANITFAVVIVIGLVSYVLLPREQDPEINFNWIDITTVLPGAAAEDVEKRVTVPLEEAIKNVQDIRFVLSTSRENVSSILVRFREIDDRTFDKRINELNREIQNKAEAELPIEAKDPRTTEITTSNGFPTAMVLLTGRADDEVLRLIAHQIKLDIERIAGVDRVFAFGQHDPELLVEFAPHALVARGANASDVADAVSGAFRDTFAGRRKTERDEWLVRVIGQEADPSVLARIAVSPLGNAREQFPLDAVATVSRARAKASQLVTRDGRPAVLFSVTKKSRTNTIELVEKLNAYIAEKNPVLAASGVSLMLSDDQTVMTQTAIRIMEGNAGIGLALVVAICWLFLGRRISILVAIGIPFSLAGTFAVLYATGNTLNVSVLLGVVIALGMLVDDAVVVVEAIYYRLQRGQEVISAAIDAMREVFAPVTSSVATTLAAFLPLMLLPGLVGEFMFVIPFVVTLALLISLVEAYWMIPTHVAALRPNFSHPNRIQRWRTRVTHAVRVKYSLALIYVMRRPLRFAAVAMLAVAAAGAAVATGVVRVQFFAFDPLRIFYVNIDMPAGAPIEATLERLQGLEPVVKKHLNPANVRAIAAIAGVKFTDTEPVFGDAYGQLAVTLQPRGEDTREAPEIVEALRKDALAVPGPGKVTFTVLSGGPPPTKAIRVRVRNDDYAELRAAADEVKRIVAGLRGTRDVTDDDLPGRPQLVLKLDREAIRAAGLTAAQVSRLVRLAVDGEIVAVMRDAGEKLEVRVRAQREASADVAAILGMPVALPGGGTTTLGQLVNEETRAGKGAIRHYNLRRSIAVEADLDKKIIDTVAANRAIEEAWGKVKLRYPSTSLDFSGELDDIEESLEAMKFLFLLGVGLIFLILAAQFRSYGQPLMILVTVPLAFTGVVFGLLVSGNPLSLYTLYGIIALTGIAVNSAIVLIDAANRRLAAGMSVLHATVYAARRRVIPILMTSTTTIAGLLSLALGLAGKSLLWGPVAGAIVWGLSVSTLLTLFVVPLVYWTFMRRSARAP